MFFVLSKVLGYLLSPYLWLLTLLLLAFVASVRGRIGATRFWLFLALSLQVIGDHTSLGPVLMNVLENRIPHSTAWQQGDGPEGIIVLGGAINERVSNNGRGEVSLNEAAERFTEALSLAHEYPQAKVVFSGLSGQLLRHGENEGELAYRLATALGLDPARIILEVKSRNTAENAQEVAVLLRDRPADKWVLITSAYHMPRAVGCFQATGWVPQPWAVDYRTPPHLGFEIGDGGVLVTWSLVARETLGLLMYWLTDRIPTPWPSLSMEPDAQVK